MDPKPFRGTLKIGDIVALNVNEQIFLNQGAQNKKKQKAERDDDEEADQVYQMFEKPDIDYKGILMSDGTTNKSFNVIPKSHDFEVNGAAMFKKCLFRVEIAQECASSEEVQVLEQRLTDKSNLKAESNIKDEENNREAQTINTEIKRIEEELAEKKKELDEERRNNDYEFEVNIGKKVTYGTPVMLRHYFSDEFLTLYPKKNARELGCVDLRLSTACERSWFKLMPSQSIKMIGECISYKDTFYLQNVQESTEFFMHVDIRPLKANEEDELQLTEGERNQLKLQKLLDINAGHEPSKFKAKLFIDFNHLLNDKLHLHSADVVQMVHKESLSILTTNARNIEITLPELPDYLKKEIKRLGGGKHYGASLETAEDKEGKNQQDLEQELRQKLKPRVLLEKNKDTLYFTNSLWEL
jgi:hypothetical protein